MQTQAASVVKEVDVNHSYRGSTAVCVLLYHCGPGEGMKK